MTANTVHKNATHETVKNATPEEPTREATPSKDLSNETSATASPLDEPQDQTSESTSTLQETTMPMSVPTTQVTAEAVSGSTSNEEEEEDDEDDDAETVSINESALTADDGDHGDDGLAGITRRVANTTISHSTYRRFANGEVVTGPGFATPGRYVSLSGNVHNTANPPPYPCRNCGGRHWRRDCPRGRTHS